jgi:hypothetical protein
VKFSALENMLSQGQVLAEKEWIMKYLIENTQKYLNIKYLSQISMKCWVQKKWPTLRTEYYYFLLS